MHHHNFSSYLHELDLDANQFGHYFKIMTSITAIILFAYNNLQQVLNNTSDGHTGALFMRLHKKNLKTFCCLLKY